MIKGVARSLVLPPTCSVCEEQVCTFGVLLVCSGVFPARVYLSQSLSRPFWPKVLSWDSFGKFVVLIRNHSLTAIDLRCSEIIATARSLPDISSDQHQKVGKWLCFKATDMETLMCRCCLNRQSFQSSGHDSSDVQVLPEFESNTRIHHTPTLVPTLPPASTQTWTSPSSVAPSSSSATA